MSLPYPVIDPVIVSLGPLALRWYSLAYIAGLFGGWWLVKKLNRRPPAVLSPRQMEDILIWALAGVVLGGRFGYVLFYTPDYYAAHPLHILKLWEGGMSFHGGLLGVMAAMLWFCRRHGLSFFAVMDMVAVAAPLGLLFGRIANFINGELYGRVTDVPWAVRFPQGGMLPRHPSQLYEAALEGLLLFAILLFVSRLLDYRRYRGLISGLFLAGYGLSRFLLEYVREPDPHLGLIGGGIFSMGQLLSLPMILFGLWLVIRAVRSVARSSQSKSA